MPQKISEVTRGEVPVARWGVGVTVLQEKIAGVTFVELRAIYLFETDFHYWIKLVFAQRMTKKAREEDGILGKVYAKKGSHCDDATISKVFFCDLSRIMRHPSAITEADLGECYDRMAHPPTSITIQSWGVPKSACKIVLPALQLMQLCLRTAFGESPQLFGGTENRPFV